MLSKLLSSYRCKTVSPVAPVLIPLTKVSSRSGYYIPVTQYDGDNSKGFKIGYVIKHKWEILPLILITGGAMGLIVYAIGWSYYNKVDVVYTTHSREGISRTMDLNHPTVHKLFTINQKYEPWPNMQATLDKMKAAEREAKLRAQSPAKC